MSTSPVRILSTSPRGIVVPVTGLVGWAALRAAAEQDDATLRAAYTDILRRAEEMETARRRAEGVAQGARYVVVCFGAPSGSIERQHTTEIAACLAAAEAKGSCSCSDARVYYTTDPDGADISEIRNGIDEMIWSA